MTADVEKVFLSLAGVDIEKDDDCSQVPEAPPVKAPAPDVVPAIAKAGRARKRLSTRQSLLFRLDDALREDEAVNPLDAGQTGGVYIVSPLNRPSLAVFKPEGEEHFRRRGVPQGGGAAREEAAYILDRMVGEKAGVPVTTQAEVPRRKLTGAEGMPGRKSSAACDVSSSGSRSTEAPSEEQPRAGEEEDGGVPFGKTCSQEHGSVQRFVPGVAGASDDFGMPNEVEAASKVVAVAAIQHIACLDIRLCNTDRHSGNLLFQRTAPEFPFVPVPIDHGCTLPRWWAMGEANFDAWIEWPQLKVPCEPEVIEALEEAVRQCDESLTFLASLGIEPAARSTYRLALTLTHAGVVKHGLPLSSVASLLCRDPMDPATTSWIEERFAELAPAAGVDWRWTTNDYGDRVPEIPADPTAEPPMELVMALEALFWSDATRKAAVQIVEERRSAVCGDSD